MNYLLDNDLDMVCGGVNTNKAVSSASSAFLTTMKKLSMVYCLGKELKHGIQEVSMESLLSAGTCIFITSFVREAIKPGKIKPE